MKYSTINKKYSTAKSEANSRWREKNWREQKCVDCGKPVQNVVSPRCEVHRRWHQIRMAANRHFMRDFT